MNINCIVILKIVDLFKRNQYLSYLDIPTSEIPQVITVCMLLLGYLMNK
jgi:hypothetical protein